MCSMRNRPRGYLEACHFMALSTSRAGNQHCNGVVLETYLLYDPLLASSEKKVSYRDDVKMRFREGETCENN